jgi:hypothetical protein
MSGKNVWRVWRRRLKAKLPYVRRREFKNLKQNYESQINHMVCEIDAMSTIVDSVNSMRSTASMGSISWAPLATHAQIDVLKPLNGTLAGEVCFFVTHAIEHQLKAHVQVHIENLLRCGVSVVLVINTDLVAHEFLIDNHFLNQLSAVFVRENSGFDFAAWAHVYALCKERTHWSRLFLINDSIVGPLSFEAFDRLVHRVRVSSADVLGLTENLLPQPHLQSFFLVFNQRALNSAAVKRIFESTLSLSTKQDVIDLYEVQLTILLKQQGLRCEALFPTLAQTSLETNDTYFRWEQLVQLGFPFIKSSVLKEREDCPKLRGLVSPLLLCRNHKTISNLFDSVNLEATILEIGGGYNPRYKKAKHPNLYHLDHLSTQELRDKYSRDINESHRIDNIQPVDFVCSGKPLHTVIPQNLKFDVIFGSHVLEHQVDLIGHLQSLEFILNKGGRVIQIIPDLRTCFDVLRYPTVTSDALLVHMRQPTIHQGKQVFDSLSRSIDQNPGRWINEADLASAHFLQPLIQAHQAVQLAEQPDQTYTDTHAWVFTPESFQLLMIELRLLKLTRLVPTFVSTTYENQFCVLLESAPELSVTDIQTLEEERLSLCKALRVW